MKDFYVEEPNNRIRIFDSYEKAIGFCKNIEPEQVGISRMLDGKFQVEYFGSEGQQ